MYKALEKYNYWDDSPIKSGFLRKRYLDSMSKYLDNSLVKVVLGQRRVGKSYLLRMLIDYLIKSQRILRKNILYINRDIHELDFINDSRQLQKVIDEYRRVLKPKGTVYLFLDEVQEIMNWEKIVNSLSQDYKSKYEVFISGSNAKLLSTELSTYLSGRYISFEVFPFSYTEFLGIKNLDPGRRSFIEYLKSGGIPESYNLDDPELKRNYYASLRDSIVLRDIVQRYNVRDVHLLGRLTAFVIDSIGSYFSIKSVVNYLKSSGRKTNTETVGIYLKYLVNSYFFHEAERYDIKGKKILSGERKLYLNDLGFKFFLSSSFEFGIGKYLENAVYLQLKRMGYSVYVGKIKGKEIDFIAEKNGGKKYIQVTYLLADEKVVEREFGNLEQVNDNFEKLVVSMDEINLGHKNGIRHLNAWDFMSTDEF